MTTPKSNLDPLFLSFQLAVAGRYSIDRELGRGGMGIVYLAREVHLDRLVAIKLLPPNKASDAGVRERFLREARLAARLSHPNIIPIHAVDETQGFVFYVMSYIHGETLAQRVHTRGPLSSTEGARIFREVAWALSHAHSHGVVHRDVKPDNILIEFMTGRVLVADFGIAAASTDTGPRRISGTPEFMSPEQAVGDEVDARSDLYSLGITAFYAMTGQLPFEGENATQVLARQVTAPAPSISSQGVPVSRKLALIVDRCMAKDPGQRPPSGDALAEQLDTALAQRREIPTPLRGFVKKSSRVNHGGLIPLAMLYLALFPVGAMFGFPAALGWFVVGTGAVSFGYLVNAARRMVRLGYTHADVEPAFNAELEASREESVIEHGTGPSGVENILRNTAQICTAASIVSVAGAFLPEIAGGFLPEIAANVIGALGSSAAFMAIASTLVYLSVLQRRRDLDTEFWAKVWTGRIGKAAFWGAHRLLGKKRPVPVAITHRATEMALGLASESLFENLPESIRRSLGDVPSLVRRLQSDSQRLRKLYDEVQDALAAAGDSAFSDTHTDLRLERDRIHHKLGEAVRALETIRLNLLRLHAGSGSVKGLTADIGLAADVSADVRRLLAARTDVERGLTFPRRTAPTPV